MTEIKKLFPQKMKVNELKIQQMSTGELLPLMELCGKMIGFYTQMKPDKTEAQKFQLIAHAIDKEMKNRINSLIIWIE